MIYIYIYIFYPHSPQIHGGIAVKEKYLCMCIEITEMDACKHQQIVSYDASLLQKQCLFLLYQTLKIMSLNGGIAVIYLY